MDGERRYHENQYKSILSNLSKNLSLPGYDNILNNLDQIILDNLETIEKHKNDICSTTGPEIYHGTAGVAFMYYYLSTKGVKTGVSSSSSGGGSEIHNHFYLRRSKEWITITLDKVLPSNLEAKKNVTFLCGSAGIFALGAVINHLCGETHTAISLMKKLKSFESVVLQQEGDNKLNNKEGEEDNNNNNEEITELLYGSVGYLWILIWIKSTQPSLVESLKITKSSSPSSSSNKLSSTISNTSVGDGAFYWDIDDTISSVWHKIFNRGINHDENMMNMLITNSPSNRRRDNNSKNNNNKPKELKYWFRGMMFLGAAHGLSGILYVLMHCPQYITKNNNNTTTKSTTSSFFDFITSPRKVVEEEENIFHNTLSFLMQTVTNGNVPWFDHNNFSTVHWCHGAPGAIYTFTEAYKLFGNEIYLNAAKQLADCIWEEGILKKSVGLCHGITGNGYAFLHMYNVTGDEMYLKKAEAFLLESLNSNITSKMRTPDSPYSLFEGLAGVTCFLSEFKDPKSARFPAYQI
eukprot:TRINITY_DN4802_c0_g1_i1.p1 TRINITY_DN4802_c0_g1~~TRINITY_DN4802_c0_g1_i1.p1  ORF type:complete len:521 (-),score=103.88 TRINITY_DN4802_c0_g1_i1:42-1604(-)